MSTYCSEFGSAYWLGWATRVLERWGRWIVLVLLLAGCGGQGAVVFAPTPLPPEIAPLAYTHPSRAFTVAVPRQWAVYEQNTTTLATAYFTPPGLEQAVIGLAVINLEATAALPDLVTLVNVYQGEIRPDARWYQEQDRQAMGDGSWRLTGARTTAGGTLQPVNTFIVAEGTFLGIIDVVIPADRRLLAELEAMVNTFVIHPDAALAPTPLATLSLVAQSELAVVNVIDWMTTEGVYFVTGEVVNNGNTLIGGIPVLVELQQADGAVVIWAADTVMGYGIPPGGYAPFSLRFGQGRPVEAVRYALTIGGPDWSMAATTPATVYGAETLTWTDTSTFSPEGYLLISGTVTNNGALVIRAPMAVVTIFDTTRKVIGARFEPVAEALLPGASLDFQLMITEFGGEPANYFLNIQGLPG